MKKKDKAGVQNSVMSRRCTCCTMSLHSIIADSENDLYGSVWPYKATAMCIKRANGRGRFGKNRI